MSQANIRFFCRELPRTPQTVQPKENGAEVIHISTVDSSSPSCSSTTSLTDYEHRTIGSLSPGPGRVCLTGVVVNLFNLPLESKAPKAAKGCLKILLRDSTGEILVKLWFADLTYEVCLGDCVSVWTTHVSSTSGPSMSPEDFRRLSACIMTSIFPERDAGCSVQIEAGESPCSPGNLLGTEERALYNFDISNLVTLEELISGSGEVIPGTKILICVLEVGDLTTVTTKANRTFHSIPISVADLTVSVPVSLSLDGILQGSASRFRPLQTILLITSPRLLSQGHNHHRIVLTAKSQILIDPPIIQVTTLRKRIALLNPPCNTLSPPPSNPSKPLVRQQYTFAQLLTILNHTSKPPTNPFYISTLLTSLSLISLYNTSSLFTMPCPICSHPTTSNTLTSTCTPCSTDLSILRSSYSNTVHLRPNPLILSGLADETGGFDLLASETRRRVSWTKPHHGFVVSDLAWEKLLGRTPGEVAEMVAFEEAKGGKEGVGAMLRKFEERVRWVRVTCVFKVVEMDDGVEVEGGERVVLRDILP